MTRPRKGWVACILIGFGTGVAVSRACSLADWLTRAESPWATGLFREIEGIPKIGKGDILCVGHDPGKPSQRFRTYHWDTRTPPPAAVSDVRSWLERMESWCAERANIVAKWTIDTDVVTGIVIVYEVGRTEGQLLCVTLGGDQEGDTPDCTVVASESRRARR